MPNIFRQIVAIFRGRPDNNVGKLQICEQAVNNLYERNIKFRFIIFPAIAEKVFWKSGGDCS
jgi:hypothetical protein